MATFQAEPEVNPGIAHLQTFLAAIAAGADVTSLIQMFAGFGHELAPRLHLFRRQEDGRRFKDCSGSNVALKILTAEYAEAWRRSPTAAGSEPRSQSQRKRFDVLGDLGDSLLSY